MRAIRKSLHSDLAALAGCKAYQIQHCKKECLSSPAAKVRFRLCLLLADPSGLPHASEKYSTPSLDTAASSSAARELRKLSGRVHVMFVLCAAAHIVATIA